MNTEANPTTQPIAGGSQQQSPAIIPSMEKTTAVEIVNDFIRHVEAQPHNGKSTQIDPFNYIETEIEKRFKKGAIARTIETFQEIRAKNAWPISKANSHLRNGNPKLTPERLSESFEITNLIQQVRIGMRNHRKQMQRSFNKPAATQDIRTELLAPRPKKPLGTVAPALEAILHEEWLNDLAKDSIIMTNDDFDRIMAQFDTPLTEPTPTSTRVATPVSTQQESQVGIATEHGWLKTLFTLSPPAEEIERLYQEFGVLVPGKRKREGESAEEGASKFQRLK